MKRRMLFCLLLSLPLSALPQISSVPGTLNQIHPDPEQKNFENEYQDLRDTIDDLDGPEAQEKSSTDQRKSKKVRLEKDRNKSEI